MTNDMGAGIITGIFLTLGVITIFHIGLNVGINVALHFLQDNSQASHILKKYRKVAHVFPYVRSSEQ